MNLKNLKVDSGKSPLEAKKLDRIPSEIFAMSTFILQVNLSYPTVSLVVVLSCFPRSFPHAIHIIDIILQLFLLNKLDEEVNA